MKGLATAALAALIWTDVSLKAIAAPNGFVDEEIFAGEGFTVDMVFTPDEKLLVVKKEGYVNLWEDPDGDYSYTKKTQILDLSGDMCDNQERALGGIQLHPDFGVSNRYIYLYYPFNKNGNCNEDAADGPVNRLSRFVVSESYEIDRDTETVFFESPVLVKAVHNGGKIEFGKDGYLYVTTGDSGVDDQSQNIENLLGSMIRLTDEGGIPPDNPFAQDSDGVRCNATGSVPSGSGKCQELYAIGLRNPWRFAMNPNTENNKVHYRINDVGASDWEEINEGGDDFRSPNDELGITNYGWPVREGPCRRGTDTNCNDYEGYQHPIHYFQHGADGEAATGGAFIPNGIWPSEYDNGYLFASFVGGTIHLLQDSGIDDCLTCNPAESNMDVSDFTSFLYVISMRFGPYKDGTMALYYVSSDAGGVMRRVYYADGQVNKPPEAIIDADATWVDAGGTVVFSGAASTDPDGGNLLFDWDFDGDGVSDSLQTEDSFTYNTSGVYDAQLTVKDGVGGQSTATVKIVVGSPQTSGYPGELFTWNSGSNYCPSGYDFCGVLEFCEGEDGRTFGYRLPCTEDQCECLGISGPLIRLVPGNKYRLTLRNAASEMTNLHTHGLHIVGDGDADDVTRTVSGGGFCLDYTWNIRSDHPGGTYWYHAHHHGLSEKQVGGGAFGMLIVEDNTSLDPVLPSWAENEHLLQVVSTPDGLIGNGRKNDVIAIDASQWYRLRVSFVSVAAVPLNFTFDDEGNCDVHKVATDGVWRSAVPGPTGTVFELTGASRADFAIRCNTSQTLVPLYYGDELASTIVVGSVETTPFVMEDWIPNRPYSLQDLSTLTVPNGNTLSVNLGYDHVNNIVWDPDVPIGTIGFDEVHEWTMLGTGTHPFHIHLYHMQIVTSGGCGAHEEGEFYDTISSAEDCVVRFRTADFGQRCVLHCHVLLHEDNGSMAWVNVTGPDMPRNVKQSFEFECAADYVYSPPTESLTSEITKQIEAWEREPHPMAHYTVQTYPVSQPGGQPTTTECELSTILVAGESMLVDEPIQSPQEDRYLILQDNGNLALMRGTPDDPGDVLWETGVDENADTYYTLLQRDGNLVTRPGSPSDEVQAGSSVWKSNTGDSEGDYFLAFNCDRTSISIYTGTLDDPGDIVWTMPSQQPVLNEPITGEAAKSFCEPVVLLFVGDMLSLDNATATGDGAFLVQEDDGNLCLKLGTPDNAGDILWESNVVNDAGAFYTTLQEDGNLITRPGTPADGMSSIWKSGTSGDIVDYFLGLNCDGLSMSIYQGTPGANGGAVWTVGGSIGTR